jgi:hypothetical protein
MGRVLVALSLVACTLLLNACGVGGPPEPTPTKLEHDVGQVKRGVEDVRELSARQDVPLRLVSTEELGEAHAKVLERYYSREEGLRESLELWLLRLIDDRSFDLYQLSKDLFTQGYVGFYVFDTKEMFVLSEGNELVAEPRAILAHEFAHALQDQHFDLQKLEPPDSDDYDRNLAVSALIEGDAQWTTGLYVQSYMPSGDLLKLKYAAVPVPPDDSPRFPYYLGELGSFPYEWGEAFVGEVLKRDLYKFEAVNKVFAAPPSSTEQIMHPEKYLDTRDDPLPVTVPPLTSTLGTGWTYEHGASIGEFSLQRLLAYNYSDDPEQEAAGWGGGRYDLYTKGEDALLTTATRWDTPEDAVEFHEALLVTFLDYEHEGDIYDDRLGRFFTASRDGDTVTFTASTDRAALERADVGR